MSAGVIGWRRCWKGRMLHYYPTWSDQQTACGQTLLGHEDDPLAARQWRRCPECSRLVAEQATHVRIRGALRTVMLVAQAVLGVR